MNKSLNKETKMPKRLDDLKKLIALGKEKGA